MNFISAFFEGETIMALKMKRNSRVIFFALSILVIAGAFIGYMTILGKQSKPEFGYHALKINGQFISPQIFQEEQNRFYLRWRTNATMLRKTDEERMDLVLEEIINRVVIEDYLYHRSQVSVTPKETDEYIQHYIKTRFDTPDKMEAFMEGAHYHNETELKKGIELYLLKLKSFPKLARELGLDIVMAEMEAKYQQHVIDNYLVLARHILVIDPDFEKARQLAGEVYRQLKNGADFAKLAMEYSADEQTKLAGGLLEPFAKNAMAPEVGEIVFQAKAGELIQPIRSRRGYEIIQVEKFINLAHPKPEFTDMYWVEKFGQSEQYKTWVTGLRAKKKIEILDPALKAYRFYSKGQYNQAGAFYEKVYTANKNQNSLDRAIDSYRLGKQWPKVIRLSDSCINKFPDQVPYYLYKAEGLYRSKQPKAALELLKKAEDLSVNNLYYSNLVIQMYATLGLEEEAARYKQKTGR
jgi:foldase protein PrsA